MRALPGRHPQRQDLQRAALPVEDGPHTITATSRRHQRLRLLQRRLVRLPGRRRRADRSTSSRPPLPPRRRPPGDGAHLPKKQLQSPRLVGYDSVRRGVSGLVSVTQARQGRAVFQDGGRNTMRATMQHRSRAVAAACRMVLAALILVPILLAKLDRRGGQGRGRQGHVPRLPPAPPAVGAAPPQRPDRPGVDRRHPERFQRQAAAHLRRLLPAAHPHRRRRPGHEVGQLLRRDRQPNWGKGGAGTGRTAPR